MSFETDGVFDIQDACKALKQALGGRGVDAQSAGSALDTLIQQCPQAAFKLDQLLDGDLQRMHQKLTNGTYLDESDQARLVEIASFADSNF